ncbi:MAG: coenzyme F420-0:L-glutamate ligase [Candidatus Bathyarchaeia archaeon]
MVVTIIGLKGIPEIKKGDDIAEIIYSTIKKQNIDLQDKDIIVVTQKIVSKSEGAIVDLSKIKPSRLALRLAKISKKDPKIIEVILRESKSILRLKNGKIISETKHGFICANAGVDKSNIEGENFVSLLPKNPDKSAMEICEKLIKLTGKKLAVIISDTFGRPWRIGQVNVAIGIAGLKPIKDYRGKTDMFNQELKVTMMAIADELASAAELVMNKSDKVPVAIVRGYDYPEGEASIKELIRPIEFDLFR